MKFSYLKVGTLIFALLAACGGSSAYAGTQEDAQTSVFLKAERSKANIQKTIGAPALKAVKKLTVRVGCESNAPLIKANFEKQICTTLNSMGIETHLVPFESQTISPASPNLSVTILAFGDEGELKTSVSMTYRDFVVIARNGQATFADLWKMETEVFPGAEKLGAKAVVTSALQRLLGYFGQAYSAANSSKSSTANQ